MSQEWGWGRGGKIELTPQHAPTWCNKALILGKDLFESRRGELLMPHSAVFLRFATFLVDWRWQEVVLNSQGTMDCGVDRELRKSGQVIPDKVVFLSACTVVSCTIL